MKKGIIITSLVVSILAIIIGGYALIKGRISLGLNGGNSVTSTINEEYYDLGFTIMRNKKILDKSKYKVSEKNNIDINNLGKYELTYTIKYMLATYKLTRTVDIIDDVKPEITTNLETVERDFCSKKDKVELTYNALDNYDGDITDRVIKTEDEDFIYLDVTDNNGNNQKISVPITYTKKPNPTFKLVGNSTVYVAYNTTYSDSGATYKDGCGNTLSDKITVSGSVDTKTLGEYKITYTLKKETLTRKVIVYNPSNITDNSPGEKIIYLTFDDGPGPYTQKILDTLAKYNVKATFFVTHQNGSYVYLMQKEHEQGHVVAAHSYTHNYNIYRSVDTYLADFNKINDDIERYTGKRSQLFRFPGGSSNTVSRSYAKGVVKAIASRMTQDGYIYFDWDVDSTDAAGGSRSSIYNHVVSGASWCKKCVVLMHDVKYNTAYELDNILKTLTSKGYKFGTLNVSSPTAHHTIVN